MSVPNSRFTIGKTVLGTGRLGEVIIVDLTSATNQIAASMLIRNRDNSLRVSLQLVVSAIDCRDNNTVAS